MVAAPDFHTLLLSHQAALERLGAWDHRESFATFLDRLWEQNQSLNLFSRRMDPATLVADHLLDSLIALPHVPPATVIADLGTGGGFPAIPLAMCMPARVFLLYEKSPLKGRFLETLRALCPNIEPRGRLEKDRVDSICELVIARGFKPLREILDLTGAYYRGGGAYMLYKGRMATLREEIRLAGIARKNYRVVRLTPLGQAEERHLLFLCSNEFSRNECRTPI